MPASTSLTFVSYAASASADTRGIHSGKENPPPKQPLNISEVPFPFFGTACLDHYFKSVTRATQFLNGFKRLGKIPAVVDYVAAGSRFKFVILTPFPGCVLIHTMQNLLTEG